LAPSVDDEEMLASSDMIQVRNRLSHHLEIQNFF